MKAKDEEAKAARSRKSKEVSEAKKSKAKQKKAGKGKKKASGKTAAEAGTTIKKLPRLNLLDDFLFSTMVAHPVVGEGFVRLLLRIVFGREFGRLSITVQKVLHGEDTDLRGARLDVCIEPEGNSGGRAMVYDVEPDKNGGGKDIKALPRRVRFYHGKLIAKNLEAGAEFDDLKDVVILMIVPYDPFGLERMLYTIENGCREVPEMPYDDGASTLFLYTKGTVGVPSEEVKQLLHYMEETTYENAVNDDLQAMYEMVEKVRNDPASSLAYWKVVHKELKMKKEAEERGMAIGEARGEAIGEARGDRKRLISQVCKKMKRNKTLEEIAEELEEEISAIEPIYNAAGKYTPDYDVDEIFQEINTNEHLRFSP